MNVSNRFHKLLQGVLQLISIMIFKAAHRVVGNGKEGAIIRRVSGVGYVCWAGTKKDISLCEELFPVAPRYMGGYVLPKPRTPEGFRELCDRIEAARVEYVEDAKGGR